MTPVAHKLFRDEIQEFLDTCSLTEKLRAHDPSLGDRLQAIESERARLLLALTTHADQAQLTERIRTLGQALANLESECTSLDDPVDAHAPPVRDPSAGGFLPERPFAVPVERLASDVRAATRRRSTLRSAMASSVPAWSLAALGLVMAGALYFFGLLPALLVAAVFVTSNVALETRRRRRSPASGEKEDRSLEGLLQPLGHPDGMTRQRARLKLVERGGPEIVAALVRGLAADDMHVRWECAKALWALPAADTADALVGVLLKDQEDSGIQWIAAEALILQGTRGVRALLRALEAQADAPSLTSGARHVFRELRGDAQLGEIVTPVFEALNHSDPALHAPNAAHTALRALDGVEHGSEPQSEPALRASPPCRSSSPEPHSPAPEVKALGLSRNEIHDLQRWEDEGGATALNRGPARPDLLGHAVLTGPASPGFPFAYRHQSTTGHDPSPARPGRMS